MLKLPRFDKDVVLGAVTLIIMIALVVVVFQMGVNRNSQLTSPSTNSSETSHIIAEVVTPPPIALSDIPRISAAAVKDKLDSGSSMIIVDTRSKEAYQRSHITGSISIPLEEIPGRYAELKSYDEIVTYCT